MRTLKLLSAPLVLSLAVWGAASSLDLDSDGLASGVDVTASCDPDGVQVELLQDRRRPEFLGGVRVAAMADGCVDQQAVVTLRGDDGDVLRSDAFIVRGPTATGAVAREHRVRTREVTDVDVVITPAPAPPPPTSPAGHHVIAGTATRPLVDAAGGGSSLVTLVAGQDDADVALYDVSAAAPVLLDTVRLPLADAREVLVSGTNVLVLGVEHAVVLRRTEDTLVITDGPVALDPWWQDATFDGATLVVAEYFGTATVHELQPDGTLVRSALLTSPSGHILRVALDGARLVAVVRTYVADELSQEWTHDGTRWSGPATIPVFDLTSLPSRIHHDADVVTFMEPSSRRVRAARHDGTDWLELPDVPVTNLHSGVSSLRDGVITTTDGGLSVQSLVGDAWQDGPVFADPAPDAPGSSSAFATRVVQGDGWLGAVDPWDDAADGTPDVGSVTILEVP